MDSDEDSSVTSDGELGEEYLLMKIDILKAENENLLVENKNLAKKNAALLQKMYSAAVYMQSLENKIKEDQKKFPKKEIPKQKKAKEKKAKKMNAKKKKNVFDLDRLHIMVDFMHQLVNSSAAVENISTLKDLSTIKKTKLNKEFYDAATANGNTARNIALRRSYIAGCYYDMILAMYDGKKFRSKRRKHNINEKKKEEEKVHVEAYTPEEIENKEYVEKHNRKCLIRYVKFKKVIDELKSENLKHRVLNCIIGVNKWEKLIVQVPTEDGGKRSGEKLCILSLICENFETVLVRRPILNVMKKTVTRDAKLEALKLILLPA